VFRSHFKQRVVMSRGNLTLFTVNCILAAQADILYFGNSFLANTAENLVFFRNNLIIGEFLCDLEFLSIVDGLF